MIRITSDWRAVDREIDRLERMPSGRTQQSLTGILHAGFELTQAAVHVESGALRASGQVSSNVDRLTHTWEGEISYGEDSGPVDYAIYEQRRGAHWVGDSAAKGDHDFLDPLKTLHEAYVLAILMGMGK